MLPISGRWSARLSSAADTTCSAARSARSTASTPERLNVASLLKRVGEGVDEVILAVNATVEGQTTAHYLMDVLAPSGVKVTRLAHGVPVGGELDYLDEGTLSAAFKARRGL